MPIEIVAAMQEWLQMFQPCRQWKLSFVLVTLMGMTGCGQRGDGPQLAAVSGTVTLNGQPFAGAKVAFDPRDGARGSMGVTDEQGKYQLEFTLQRTGAVVGEHTVSIHSDSFAGEGAADPQVPARYNSQSELTATVHPRGNVINFDLITDQGQKKTTLTK